MLQDEPPAFVQLAGNDVRWRLLRELAQSDQRVRELMATTDQPQNLVSYHLGRLRQAGLVTMRRSNADGRDVYYHLDLEKCADFLASTAEALHPALKPQPKKATARKAKVAFLCTGNSARSPMAAALLAHRTQGRVTTTSAGSDPKPLRPFAKRALSEYGIDLAGHRPRHVETITTRRFDLVISLCDRVREVCPEFDHHPRQLHWSIPDPGDGDYETYRELAAELDRRIRFLIPVLDRLTEPKP
jgi:protein-tyrosine-phosphatase/DNA-binding transcriptional ArsR family regulator